MLSIGHIKGSAAENKYFFTRNEQNDIVAVYRSSDSKLIGTYEYDLWGKPVSIKEATPGIDTDGILTKNPLRYRSYRYDAETGFYHLKSRYYDPNIRRFISADTVAVLTVETTSPGFKNLFAYCENNPVMMEDSTGQAGVVIFGVFVGADIIFDWVGLTISAIDLAHNLKDPLAYAGVVCDFIDLFFPGCYSGEAINAVKYSVRHGSDITMWFASKFGDEAAEMVVKHGDEVIEGGKATLAQYGDDFGKMGTYVENPNIKVDWTQYAEHAAERMQQRGMTQEMVNNIVENGKVLSQNNGNKFAYITQEGVAIVSKEGKLITAWSSAEFDSSMLEIISKLFGE